jgi:hypothetical protein
VTAKQRVVLAALTDAQHERGGEAVGAAGSLTSAALRGTAGPIW